MKPFARSERVCGQIQKILSDLLQKKINDPRLEMATVTGVKMSRDLKIAYIYFTISGGKKNQENALEGFSSATGFLKKALAKRLGLRYMPDLKFIHDESFDYGSRIDSLLKSIQQEQELP
ncbi:MAG: 30S ribosome-binding factor RbfA [Proteobacteria bacterium]|nr:30S ribosome-binding factor RbfA [Pseudomonadota bacterium]